VTILVADCKVIHMHELSPYSAPNRITGHAQGGGQFE